MKKNNAFRTNLSRGLFFSMMLISSWVTASDESNLSSQNLSATLVVSPGGCISGVLEKIFSGCPNSLNFLQPNTGYSVTITNHSSIIATNVTALLPQDGYWGNVTKSPGSCNIPALGGKCILTFSINSTFSPPNTCVNFQGDNTNSTQFLFCFGGGVTTGCHNPSTTCTF